MALPEMTAVNKVLREEGIPVILWGEFPMEIHGIPTVLFRDDVLIPDEFLDNAAVILKANGWTDSTGPLPLARTGFWRRGWEAVAQACRRFHHPGQEDDLGSHELLILPTSFVGLASNPPLDTEDFIALEPNMYYPTPQRHLECIIGAIILHPDASGFVSLARAWASYYAAYCGFRSGSLDSSEPHIRKWWEALMARGQPRGINQ